MKRPLLIIFGVLILDQFIKIWVKTHMLLGQEFRLTNWCMLHFTENNGMAFGMEFGGDYGKIILSVFRILFVIAISFYLYKLVKSKADPLYITCIALVIAGATGNIIDCTFYGKIFSTSDYQLAQLFPAEGGYSSILHGKVVDMFYFPIIQGEFPKWFPIWHNQDYEFFRPIFNLADSSISVGVILMLIFQKRFFAEHPQDQNTELATETPAEGEGI